MGDDEEDLDDRLNFLESRKYDPGFYALEGHTPVKIFGVLNWGMRFQDTEQWVVKQETVGDYWVSTVFLGLDHQFGSGPPLLFESIVFIGDQCGATNRYSTWDEALAGHESIVEKIKESG